MRYLLSCFLMFISRGYTSPVEYAPTTQIRWLMILPAQNHLFYMENVYAFIVSYEVNLIYESCLINNLPCSNIRVNATKNITLISCNKLMLIVTVDDFSVLSQMSATLSGKVMFGWAMCLVFSNVCVAVYKSWHYKYVFSNVFCFVYSLVIYTFSVI